MRDRLIVLAGKSLLWSMSGCRRGGADGGYVHTGLISGVGQRDSKKKKGGGEENPISDKEKSGRNASKNRAPQRYY